MADWNTTTNGDQAVKGWDYFLTTANNDLTSIAEQKELLSQTTL